MPNTALNRTTQALLTNKSGGALTYGAVVVLDNTNDNGFTTTTSGALSTRGIGVILEPSGIANNASGMVAIGGWVPQINLNTAATDGQFIKTHTVAGQGTPHASPQVEGDFAVALTASATPAAMLFGSANGPTSGGAGTVTNTGTLTDHAVVVGNGGVDVSTLATGSAGQILVSAGSGSDPGWTTRGVIQVVNTQSGAVATGSTIMPLDDTIPQKTEGDEYMTLAITPTNASSKLLIQVVGFWSGSIATYLSMGLFQDTTDDALAATTEIDGNVTFGGVVISLTYYMTAGTTSSTTFKVRVGGSGVQTTTFNGRNAGRHFGGIPQSSITITEIAG